MKKLLPISRALETLARELIVARTCFEVPRLVPYGHEKAADLQSRSALHLFARGDNQIV